MTDDIFEGMAVEFTILPAEEEPDYPKYSDVGRILFEIYHIYREKTPPARWELEVHDYDADSSVYWAFEGVGLDYFLNDIVGLDLDDCGWYVLEGIHGYYFRGDWGFTDDDEEWHYGNVRRATQEEIDNQALEEKSK